MDPWDFLYYSACCKEVGHDLEQSDRQYEELVWKDCPQLMFMTPLWRRLLDNNNNTCCDDWELVHYFKFCVVCITSFILHRNSTVCAVFYYVLSKWEIQGIGNSFICPGTQFKDGRASMTVQELCVEPRPWASAFLYQSPNLCLAHLFRVYGNLVRWTLVKIFFFKLCLFLQHFLQMLSNLHIGKSSGIWY